MLLLVYREIQSGEIDIGSISLRHAYASSAFLILFFSSFLSQRKPGQLRYGVLSHHGPSKNKVVIVTVDPERCDERLTARLGLNCTRRVEQSGVKT